MENMKCAQNTRPYAVVAQIAGMLVAPERSRVDQFSANKNACYLGYLDTRSKYQKRFGYDPTSVGLKKSITDLGTETFASRSKRYTQAARSLFTLFEYWDDIVVLEDPTLFSSFSLGETAVEQLLRTEGIPDNVYGAPTKSLYMVAPDREWEKMRLRVEGKLPIWGDQASDFAHYELMGGYLLTREKADIFIGTGSSAKAIM